MKFWCCFFLVFASVPALADWQYTKWGMTPEQVVAASKGAARIATDDEKRTNKSDVVGEYKSDGFSFNVSFRFSNGKLRQVELVSKEKDLHPALRTAMAGRYGAHVSQKRNQFTSITLWRDEREKNTIELLDLHITDTILIIYEPIARGL